MEQAGELVRAVAVRPPTGGVFPVVLLLTLGINLKNRIVNKFIRRLLLACGEQVCFGSSDVG